MLSANATIVAATTVLAGSAMLPVPQDASVLGDLYGSSSTGVRCTGVAHEWTLFRERYYASHGAIVFNLVKNSSDRAGIDLKPFAPVMADLHAISCLASDWDAEGASEPDQKSFAAATSFLRSVKNLNAWSASVHADGRVALEYDDDHRVIELLFGPDEHVVKWDSETRSSCKVAAHEIGDL